MATVNIKTITVNLPGSGGVQTYSLTPDTMVKFGFDLSEAVFAGVDGDLVITVEGGGIVVLKGYMALAEAGRLPTFEMMDGEQTPGDFYMFAFAEVEQTTEEGLETAAGGQAGGSGAGEYSDDPGTLGDGLEALGGQGDAYDVREPAAAEEIPAAPLETAVVEEGEPVQIVLNPGFEGRDTYYDDGDNHLDGIRSFNGDSFMDIDRWDNEGTMGYPNGILTFASPVFLGGPSPAEQYGMYWDGEGLNTMMQLDTSPFFIDTMTQSIAVQAGESATVAFSFAPQLGEVNPGTNDFKVLLGEQEVATVNWGGQVEGEDGMSHIWLVTLGEGVTLPAGSPLLVNGEGDYYFVNNGVSWGDDESMIPTWTELSFTLTVEVNHSELTFIEDVMPYGPPVITVYDNGLENGQHEGGINDGFGTLIDNVSVYRDFDEVIYDESDFFMDWAFGANDRSLSEYLTDNVAPILGTAGEDAIFGDTPEEDGTRPILDGEETGLGTLDLDVVNGLGGDDAIYGGNGVNLLLGGEGNDFVVGGRGLNLMAGEEGDDFLGGGRGLNILVGGVGNDIIEAGEGRLDVFQEGGELADLLDSGPGFLEDVLENFNSANIIVTGDGHDAVELNDGLDVLFINEDVVGSGENTVTVENFNAFDHPLDGGDFLVLGDGVEIVDDDMIDGNLHLYVETDGDPTDSVEVILQGVPDGPWLDAHIIETGGHTFADEINDLVQQIIDSGGDLAA